MLLLKQNPIYTFTTSLEMWALESNTNLLVLSVHTDGMTWLVILIRICITEYGYPRAP